jgi:pyruvyl transferase EpsO
MVVGHRNKENDADVLPVAKRFERMRTLAKMTETVATAIPRGARIGFVDYPMHINLGDQLILLGALDFFRWNQNEIHTSFCVFNQTRQALERLKACDVIVCHGGGNFGDIYPQHQKLREHLIELYPDKPIIIMPQSVHFSDETAQRKSAAIFRKHRTLTVFVRDEYSLGVVRSQFCDNVVACPDMAHRLLDMFSTCRPASDEHRPLSALALMRRDAEAVSALSEIGHQASVDWTDIMTLAEKVQFWRHRAAVRVSGALGGYDADRLDEFSKTLSAILPAIARRLVRHDTWLTSRLHGAIFGLLLERDVVLFDNSYGKNSRYFSLWGEGLLKLVDRSEHAQEDMAA